MNWLPSGVDLRRTHRYSTDGKFDCYGKEEAEIWVAEEVVGSREERETRSRQIEILREPRRERTGLETQDCFLEL